MSKKLKSFTNTSNGIEVLFYDGWFDSAPRCPHGPMLLFERYTMSLSGCHKYFACSASRNRKQCQGFMYEEDYVKSKKKSTQTTPACQHEKVLHHEVILTYKNVCSIPPAQRNYCFQCQNFFIEGKNNHGTHRTLKNVTKAMLLSPTKLLSSLQDDKVHAQYFISDRSTDFLHSTLKALNVTHLVCLGMPRVHEVVQQNQGNSFKSILLDIDHRFKMFWPPSKFVHFNMFNHYLFDKAGQESLKSFFLDCSTNKGNLAIVTDPPFGGLVDCICETLKWLKQEYGKLGDQIGDSVAIMWLFPYYMERRIVTNMKDFHMLDYHVDYDNHKKFKNADKGRKMTPVRIFTNVRNDLVKLPAGEGYRFCKKCQRYVYKNNKHCDICKTCPSKDGRTYVHCKKCGKCEKPGREHCATCGRCELPGHECAQRSGRAIGCHICGELDHKRRDCPVRSKKRRTAADASSQEGKAVDADNGGFT